MSTAEAASLTFAIVFLALGLLALGLCRAAARADRAAEVARTFVWDTAAQQWIRIPAGAPRGPGQLTVHEVAESDALEVVGAFDRLHQAIRDEQQKGEL